MIKHCVMCYSKETGIIEEYYICDKCKNKNMTTINDLKVGDRVKCRAALCSDWIGTIVEIVTNISGDKRFHVKNLKSCNRFGYDCDMGANGIVCKLEPIIEYKEIPIEKESRKINNLNDLKVGDTISFRKNFFGNPNCIYSGTIRLIITQGDKTYYNISLSGNNSIVLVYPEDIILDKPIEKVIDVTCIFAEKDTGFHGVGPYQERYKFFQNKKNPNNEDIDIRFTTDEWGNLLEPHKKYQITIKEI